MLTPAERIEPWVTALVPDWVLAVARSSYVPMDRSELEDLFRTLAVELAAAMNGKAPAGGSATRVADALVAAHLTDPAALEATLSSLDRHVPPGPWSTSLRVALAAQYARALRSVTLIEQEQLARAIIVAQVRSDRAARQSEARFRAIFAGAVVGIGISDESGRIVQVNQALADMLGYTPEEMCGLSVPAMAHPTDPPEMWESYAQMSRGEIDHLRMEKAYFRKDGEEVWTDLTVTLIKDDGGQPQFNVAMMDDITDRHRFDARLRHQAMHDPLTALPNRALFADRLAAVIAGADPSSRVGLCYLDLDGFKRINDTLGHDVGDQLLVSIAERLGHCAAERGHLAARMGGDEFVILVERSRGPRQLAALAEAALAAVAAPVSVGPHRLRVTASIGVVEGRALGVDPAEILKAADVTLYRAKARGRGRWELYDAEAVAEEIARYELAAALPDALERGEFSLVYQPIVNVPDWTLLGFEALVRWNHPRLGVIPPDRFIGLAEETGLIVPLGRHVLGVACREASTWGDRLHADDLFVSVNVAAAQTHEPSLPEDVSQTLAETGLKASRLQLELTESALMATVGAPLKTLHALAATGVRMAIDDFGTGYSNLAYLPSLPVHTLKLPRPFVQRLQEPTHRPTVDDRIVDALIGLAHAIELTVTAEGVETGAQVARLRTLGCDSVQGWYIAPPCDAHDLARAVRDLQRHALQQHTAHRHEVRPYEG